MSNSKVKSSDLKSFLSRFFESNFEISDKILVISEKFLFSDDKHPDVKNQQELQSTLLYLKEVMESNDLKTLDDLIQYYDRKRKKISTLIEKYEQNDSEECLAIDFQQACAIYIKPVKIENVLKSTCLYYLQNSNYSRINFYVPYQYFPKIDELNLPTHEEERNFMAQIKGNLLITNKNKCCIPEEKIDEMVSN